VVRAFQAEGIQPVVIDDLSSGMRGFVPDGVPFVKGDILDTDLVARLLSEHRCSGVVHVAGFSTPGCRCSSPSTPTPRTSWAR